MAQLLQLQATPDLVERVYGAVLDAISDGSLPPGQRVTQEDLARQLAVSRQPVLQALRQLKTDGFVQDAPGRGLMVAPLDARWMRNVYQVRGALDRLAAQEAARLHFPLDDGLITRGRQAASGSDIKAMIDADLAFHNAIYQASGNPLIELTAAHHWRHLRRVMGGVLQSSGQREAVWDEHAAIARAIRAGDVAQAGASIEDHSTRASAALAQRLSQLLITNEADTA
jgi:DNA-binding GntR family transcriptional regulator